MGEIGEKRGGIEGEREPRQPSNYIVKYLYEKKLREHRERLDELRNPKIIYVSDLVYCPLKRRYRLLYPELTFSFEPPMILGDLLHTGLQQTLREMGFEIEKEISETFVVGGEEYLLKGRMDAYREDLIVEIKTSRSGAGLPHPHHMLQLRIYMVMTGVRKGLLIYLTGDRIVEYPVEWSEINLGELIEKHLGLAEYPVWDWECRICPFNKICPYRIDR